MDSGAAANATIQLSGAVTAGGQHKIMSKSAGEGKTLPADERETDSESVA
jgi:hypothetical protein